MRAEPETTLRRALLACGLLSSLLYVGIDVLAAVRYGDYHSFASQTLSELGALGAPTKRGDLPHIVVFSVISLLIMVGVASGAFALGRRFRSFSFAVLGTMLVSGALTGFAARAIPTGAPTPWIGLTERIDVGAYLLWVAVLGVALFREESSRAVNRVARPGLEERLV